MIKLNEVTAKYRTSIVTLIMYWSAVLNRVSAIRKTFL